MADDKAPIDWTMLEAAAAETRPSQVGPPGKPPSGSGVRAQDSSRDASAAKPPEKSAGKSQGKIAFHCPNGHRVIAAAAMAGQRGKCSKCGAAVRIPGQSASRSVSAPRTQPSSLVSPASDEAEAEDREQSADVQGGDGGMPPTAAPRPAEAVDDMFSGLVTTGESHASATDFVELSQQLSHLSGQDRSSSVEQPPLEPMTVGESGGSPPPNLTATLMARLFQEVQHGGIVEVHITGGSVIMPEFYEPRWSVGAHGLFASRAADGTVTLTAVAWDSIQKIIVRQVDGLPDGMFE